MEAKIDADRQRQEQMFQWMQNLGAKMGEPLPQALFLPPCPPEDTHVSTSIPISTHSHTHSHTHQHTHTHTHTRRSSFPRHQTLPSESHLHACKRVAINSNVSGNHSHGSNLRKSKKGWCQTAAAMRLGTSHFCACMIWIG